MMLVDSSVWIDYFTGTQNLQTDYLDSALGKQRLCIGDLILTEVLQGFRQDKHFKQAKSLLSALPSYDLLGTKMAHQSANNFRWLRKRGITVRKTADVIIATFCIEHKIPLLSTDRDFKPFVKHMGLIEAGA
ncbi:PIN domain nuclease [SAR92 clade bacterium H231]|nr:PIN domain nuclease [SAR92 clade bacterium H231]